MNLINFLTDGQDHLRAIFCKTGPLNEVTIVKHESTGKNKGFAFVGYTNVFDAAKAVAECNGAQLHGSCMRIIFFPLIDFQAASWLSTLLLRAKSSRS